METFETDPSWDAQDEGRNHNTLLDGEIVLWRNAQWRVTNMHIEEKADPGRLGPPYWIPATSDYLGDPNLVQHVCLKTWVDADLFVEAYEKACELTGQVPVGIEAIRNNDSIAEMILARSV